MSIVVQRHGHVPGGLVTVTMQDEEARRLFHAVNRMLSLVDDMTDDERRPSILDPADEAAYVRANAFLAQLQRELNIDPNQENSDG